MRCSSVRIFAVLPQKSLHLSTEYKDTRWKKTQCIKSANNKSQGRLIQQTLLKSCLPVEES